MLSQGLLRQSGHAISRFIKAVRACLILISVFIKALGSQELPCAKLFTVC